MSLQLRLVVSIMLVLLVSLILGGALVCWHAARSVDDEMTAAVEVGAHSIENALAQLPRAQNPGQELSRLIGTFDGDRHVLAVLLNGQDEPALVSQLATPQRAVPDWFVQLLGVTPKVLRFPLPAAVGGRGAIMLQADLRNEVGEVWGQLGDSLVVLGLFSLLVLLLVSWTVRRGLMPLETAIGSFRRIGAGDYGARLAPRGAPELVRLAEGFNQMAERLAGLEANNRRLHERLRTLQDEERADLARDLHDEIGPFLFAVSVDAAAIPQLATTGSRIELAQRVATIREAVAHMQRQVKAILGRLRPAGPLGLGLADAVETLAQFWRRRYPEVEIRIDLAMGEVSRDDRIDGTIYRVVQEGLSNAVRHGHPTRILVTIAVGDDDGVRMSIVDDGDGLADAAEGTGFGLIGMAERLAALGGSLEVANRRDGRGVTLTAVLPCCTPVPSAIAS
ncbi:histidine kinase [Aliidongia sp.]|uniref:histidine kinase n=1 Tax=Aliidongia sp. TaxID=1914230 RepID=UPI002DDDAA9D|nr:histidine kinase [Aliidongia sp.]